MSASAATYLQMPFLGLHYFDEEHREIFFGREEQVRDLLHKMEAARFVTVIGSSGTGKSSLVRAGLIPSLRAGFLPGAGSSWQIIKMRPGNAPICNLSSELEKVFGKRGLELTLRRGPLGLVEAARQCGLKLRENLVVVADQFEEIFRYQREAKDRHSASEECAAFVKLLLEASASPEVPIFVLITMRSDYLGACAQFRDLPERINSGLYLIPRMRRDQLEEAIAGPVALAGARFSPALVQRLLNDAGEDPDQLPVLQHALLRAWLKWKADARPEQEIAFKHYELTGGVREGLNQHANEIYNALKPAEQQIAEVIFRSLTERDPSNNDIRRPTELGVIARIAGVSSSEAARVADKFRDEGVSFLTPTAPVELADDTVLDITHESLIRKWDKLSGSRERKGWVQQEAELRDQYRDLVKRARKALNNREVLGGSDLDEALRWREMKLNSEWALRQVPAEDAFKLVLDYIQRSEETRERLQKRNFLLKMLALAGIFLILILGPIIWVKLSSQKELRAALQLSTARQLSTQAQSLSEKDSSMEVSALLAIESLKHAPHAQGFSSVYESLNLLRNPLWIQKGGQLPQSDEDETDQNVAPTFPILQFSGSGSYLAQVSPDAKLHLYTTADGKEVPVPPLEKVDSLAWEGDRLRVLVVTGADADGKVPIQVRTFSPGSQETSTSLSIDCTGHCNFTPDGQYLLVSGKTIRTVLYALNDNGKKVLAPQGDVLAIDVADKLMILKQGDRRSEGGQLVTFANKSLGSFEMESSAQFLQMTGGAEHVIASAIKDRAVMLYKWGNDPAEGDNGISLAGQYPAASRISAISLSPDGQLLALADETGGVRVVDWASQSRLAVWSHSSPVTTLAFSNDGKLIASRDDSGEVHVIALKNNASGSSKPLEAGTRQNMSFTFDPAERFVIAKYANRYAQIFDMAGKRVGESAQLVALSPDAQFKAAKSERHIEIRNIQSGALVKDLQLQDSVTGLALSPAGQYIALIAKSETNNYGLRVLRVADGAAMPVPSGLDSPAGPIFSPDGRYLALRLGKLKEYKLVLIDCTTWKFTGPWAVPWDGVATSFSADGKFLLTRYTGGRIYDTANPGYLLVDTASNAQRNLPLPGGTRVSAARFSADSRLLAVATRDRSVRIFDLQSGQAKWEIATPSSATQMAFSRSGRYLGVGSSSFAPIIYDRNADFHETSATFLKDSERLLSFRFADDDRSILLISRTSGAQRGVLLNQESLLAEEVIKQGCATVSRNLTSTEWKTYLPNEQCSSTCPNLPFNCAK